jgi:hypothetical protein
MKRKLKQCLEMLINHISDTINSLKEETNEQKKAKIFK